jgi:hypothetical protein
VPFVTIGELVKWAEVHRWGLRKWTELADWLGRVVVLPYDVQVAYTWGQLAATARQRGRPRPANDMWVAILSRVLRGRRAPADVPASRLSVRLLEWIQMAGTPHDPECRVFRRT